MEDPLNDLDDSHYIPPPKPQPRRGKAPPIDPFTGENPEVRLEDWLPSLKRAGEWNGWSDKEQLLQLAGHLRGRALQEWNLLSREQLSNFDLAVKTLKERLDPGSKVLAGQDFRHTTQGETESVADFIRRLERTFQIAFGSGVMSTETREAILYGQMQEGLRWELMRSPNVSGAMAYKELCVAAKGEEHRQSELKKRQQYQKQSQSTGSNPSKPPSHKTGVASSHNKPSGNSSSSKSSKTCYNCGKIGHLAYECRSKRGQKKTESSGSKSTAPQTKQIQSTMNRESMSNPLDFLFLSSDDEMADVLQVRVTDHGSHPHCAKVIIQGVPAYGIIDSGADITIIGGSLFKRVATMAHLKK